jgi:hypothetical protein
LLYLKGRSVKILAIVNLTGPNLEQAGHAWKDTNQRGSPQGTNLAFLPNLKATPLKKQ